METWKEVLILKVSGSTVEGVIDPVASEQPVTLTVNGEQIVTLLCTPSELRELGAGFLLSEGILTGPSSLKTIAVDEKTMTVHLEVSELPTDFDALFAKRTLSSGCGKGITFTHSRTNADGRLPVQEHMVTLDDIRRLLNSFRTISKLYLETGGVHSAALSDGKDILFFSEDIGRHNAVDKLIGKAFLQSISVENRILLTSGRVTSEIITKAGRNRFPILISRAAPSCMAINYAEDMGITLVGFARGERMNIYSWPKRIKTD
jgi:FdhD protein